MEAEQARELGVLNPPLRIGLSTVGNIALWCWPCDKQFLLFSTSSSYVLFFFNLFHYHLA